MKRSRSIISQMHSAIGSATHWMFRGLLVLIEDKFDIELPDWLERNIAYVATGLFLLLIGVWHYLPWLPGINISSIRLDLGTLLGIGTVVLAFLSWRAAQIGSDFARQAVEDGRSPRLNLRHIPEWGGFYFHNIGKDTAKNIREAEKRFQHIPTELLCSTIPLDPRITSNRSAVDIISLERVIDPKGTVNVVFDYENSFGNKFTSEFVISNPHLPPYDFPYEVKEKWWAKLD